MLDVAVSEGQDIKIHKSASRLNDMAVSGVTYYPTGNRNGLSYKHGKTAEYKGISNVQTIPEQ